MKSVSAAALAVVDLIATAISFTPVVGNAATQTDSVLLGWYSLNHLAEAIGDLGTFPRALLLIAVGLAAVVHRALPRWLGWYSPNLAALSLLGGLALTTLANALSPAWLAALFGYTLWPLLLACSLLLRRRPATQPAQAPTASQPMA